MILQILFTKIAKYQLRAAATLCTVRHPAVLFMVTVGVGQAPIKDPKMCSHTVTVTSPMQIDESEIRDVTITLENETFSFLIPEHNA